MQKDPSKAHCQKVQKGIQYRRGKRGRFTEQKPIEITSDGKGIRLDVYIEDDKNTVYDIEMQTTPQKELPKRSRYYQGMIDLNLIERGAQYGALKKSIVIFICLQDPFDKGLYAYHFSNKCWEIPDMELQDETLKVFLNAAGHTGNISRELKEFLDYLAKKPGTGEFTGKLEDAVQKAREHEEWRLEYMILMQRDRQNREEGRKEGRKEGLIEGIGALVETLKELEQPVESIVKKIMEKFGLSEAEAKKYV